MDKPYLLVLRLQYYLGDQRDPRPDVDPDRNYIRKEKKRLNELSIPDQASELVKSIFLVNNGIPNLDNLWRVIGDQLSTAGVIAI